MKTQIGYRESSSALTIFSLAPAFSVLGGVNSLNLGMGAFLNCVICFCVSLFLLFSLKIYLRDFESVSIIDAAKEFGTIAQWIVTLVFSVIIFSLAVMSISLLSKNVYALVSERIEINNIRLLICVISAACALCGLEALTRQSYILFFVSVVFILFITYSVIRGLNTDNLSPVFGTNVRDTLLNGYSFSLLAGFAPFLLVCNCIGDKKSYDCVKRTVITTFAIVAFMLLLYSLTVPVNFNSLSQPSFQKIFALSNSGSLLHRYELFLASLYVIIAIVASSFSLISVSYALAKISDIEDFRPFVLILLTLLYTLSKCQPGEWLYLSFCIAATFVSVFLPLVFSVIKRKSRG